MSNVKRISVKRAEETFKELDKLLKEHDQAKNTKDMSFQQERNSLFEEIELLKRELEMERSENQVLEEKLELSERKRKELELKVETLSAENIHLMDKLERERAKRKIHESNVQRMESSEIERSLDTHLNFGSITESNLLKNLRSLSGTDEEITSPEESPQSTKEWWSSLTSSLKEEFDDTDKDTDRKRAELPKVEEKPYLQPKPRRMSVNLRDIWTIDKEQQQVKERGMNVVESPTEVIRSNTSDSNSETQKPKVDKKASVTEVSNGKLKTPSKRSPAFENLRSKFEAISSGALAQAAQGKAPIPLLEDRYFEGEQVEKTAKDLIKLFEQKASKLATPRIKLFTPGMNTEDSPSNLGTLEEQFARAVLDNEKHCEKSNQTINYEDDELIVHVMDGKKIVLSGTPRALVAALLNPEIKGKSCGIESTFFPPNLIIGWTFDASQSELGFVDGFLLSYRAFISPLEFFELLKEQYVESTRILPGPFAVRAQLRVIGILKMWLEKYFSDFVVNDKVLNLVQDWCQMLKKTNKRWGQLLLEVMDKQQEEAFFGMRLNNTVDFPESSKTLLDFQTVEFAMQLALKEFDLFKRISLFEITNTAWNLEEKEQLAPTICRMFELSQKVTTWVITEIVSTQTLEKRIAVLSHFISIAQYCAWFHFYNGLFEIMSALISDPVLLLKETWRGLSKECVSAFNELKELTSSEDFWRNYRARLTAVKPGQYPTLPCLELFLKGITFAEQASSTWLENGHVDFQKMDMLGYSYAALKIAQNTPYAFENLPELQYFLDNMKVWDVQQIISYAETLAAAEATEASASASLSLTQPLSRVNSTKTRGLIDSAGDMLRRKQLRNQKYNSTSTPYIDSTISKPDNARLLHCIAVYLCHLIYPKRSFNAQDKKQVERYSIFDETLHPITTTNVEVNEVPTVAEVESLVETVFKTAQLAPESLIMAVAYLQRAVKVAKFRLFPHTWKRMMLSCLILASKVWEEQAVWNSDFLDMFPLATSHDVTRLEKQLISLLSFEVSLRASEYATIYFDLRSQVPHHYLESEEFDEVKPLSKDAEDKLEVLSQSYADKAKEVGPRFLIRSTGSVDSFNLQKRAKVKDMDIPNVLN